MRSKSISARFYIITFLVVVGLGVSYYLILGQKANMMVTNQFLKRQLTLARAQTGNIASFYKVFGDSVAIFSRLNSVHARNSDLQSNLDSFVDQSKDGGLVGGISVVNEEGIIEFNSNISGIPDVGDSISDRDYFEWAKEQTSDGLYFIGSPINSRIGATEGETIIPVAAPIIDNGVFRGAVVSPIRMSVLTERYLEYLKISDLAEIYLINIDGKMIYSNLYPNLVGNNIYELIENNPFLGSDILTEKIKNILNEKKEGSMMTSFINGKTNLIKDYYLAYSPISLNSQNWMLVTATPIEALTDIKTPLDFRLKIMLFLIFVTFVVYGYSIKKGAASNIQSVIKKPENQNKL